LLAAHYLRQLEAGLSALDVLRLEAPVDAAYGIGGNDLLIAAHAHALDHTLVTYNEHEFHGSKI
jgi:tRNA(fMet)-specific endonuclease VapC